MTTCSAAGDDMRRPGNDTIDGGDGDDIEIQSVGGDTVTSATAVGKDWLATHASTVSGKTVLDLGLRQVTLPQADLADLMEGTPHVLCPAILANTLASTRTAPVDLVLAGRVVVMAAISDRDIRLRYRLSTAAS